MSLQTGTYHDSDSSSVNEEETVVQPDQSVVETAAVPKSTVNAVDAAVDEWCDSVDQVQPVEDETVDGQTKTQFIQEMAELLGTFDTDEELNSIDLGHGLSAEQLLNGDFVFSNGKRWDAVKKKIAEVKDNRKVNKALKPKSGKEMEKEEERTQKEIAKADLAERAAKNQEDRNAARKQIEESEKRRIEALKEEKRMKEAAKKNLEEARTALKQKEEFTVYEQSRSFEPTYGSLDGASAERIMERPTRQPRVISYGDKKAIFDAEQKLLSSINEDVKLISVSSPIKTPVATVTTPVATVTPNALETLLEQSPLTSASYTVNAGRIVPTDTTTHSPGAASWVFGSWLTDDVQQTLASVVQSIEKSPAPADTAYVLARAAAIGAHELAHSVPSGEQTRQLVHSMQKTMERGHSAVREASKRSLRSTLGSIRSDAGTGTADESLVLAIHKASRNGQRVPHFDVHTGASTKGVDWTRKAALNIVSVYNAASMAASSAGGLRAELDRLAASTSSLMATAVQMQPDISTPVASATEMTNDQNERKPRMSRFDCILGNKQ